MTVPITIRLPSLSVWDSLCPGIPEEEAVRQVMMHYYREADEQLVRMTLHNLYRECKGFGTRSSMTRDQITAFRLEEFMNRR